MTEVKFGTNGIYILLLILTAFIALFEYGGFFGDRGALLLTLAFWAALIQGAIAVAAVTLLVRAKWIGSLRRELLSLYPLLLLLAVLFALLWPQMDLYPWREHPTAWLNRNFFMLRNLAALLLTFLAGRTLARRSATPAGASDRHAVIYLLLFVVSQSLVGYDWVMSAAYPWVNTLFGMYFFAESLYGGIALAGMLLGLYHRARLAESPRETPVHVRDVGLLLFGFSVLWAGLFFAQYLLIWYGNIPEEVHFIVERISASPYRELSWFFLLALFAAPFTTLLGAGGKRDIRVVALVSLVILAGLFAERMLFLLPVVPQHGGGMVVYNLLLTAATLVVLQSRDEILPPGTASV
ncbi:MAG: hypothetical protein R2940_08545 [Syntrophotaleaceae bacterium]